MQTFLKDLFRRQDTGAGNFFLIAGPCVVEGEDVVMRIAEQLVWMCVRLRVPLVFKASYRKANRSRLDSFSGIGDEAALKIMAKVKITFGIPLLTDIHAATEAEMAAAYADVLQVPAFLCRQTDILVAAAQTGKVVNVKKGQFVSPESMRFAVDKLQQNGNDKVVLTDRGTMFGYQELIVDFRSIPVMQAIGVPVVQDCTHALQRPNQPGGVTGGHPAMIETIARAAIAVGADGLFIETHSNPERARSDGANMLNLALLEPLLERLVALRQLVKQW